MKNVAPGVPDLYQGGELWDLSLVDPDNRRPVDYELRRRLLDEMGKLSVEAVVSRADEGLTKLWTIFHSLHLRREHPEWFREGAAYQPIPVTGERAAHGIAFQRGEQVLAVVPRMPLRVADAWGSTSVELPTGTWTNRLTGETYAGGPVRLGTLFAKFPVALLIKEIATNA